MRQPNEIYLMKKEKEEVRYESRLYEAYLLVRRSSKDLWELQVYCVLWSQSTMLHVQCSQLLLFLQDIRAQL